MTAKEKMVKAKVSLMFSAPFFGSIAYRLKFTENDIGKVYTDGKVLSYDPNFVDQQSIPALKGIIAHEVMHIAMMHHTRERGKDHEVWNVSCDYAINSELIKSGFELPKDALYNTDFSDQAAETIYNTIYGKKQDDEQGDQGEQGQGNQDGQGQGEQGQGNNDQDNNGQGQGKSDQGLKPPNWGEVIQNNDPNAEVESQIMIQQAAMAGKAAGKLPAGLARLIQEILTPKVDWRTILRDFVERSAKNDYSYAKINTRYIHTGFYLPTLISDDLPEMVIAVDTSGSISQRDLDQIVPELQSILDTFNTSINVLYCDYDLDPASSQHFDSGDVIELKPVGGGGTSFIPVFEHIEKENIDPACLIYITDLCGQFPDHAPDYPVLWIDSHDYGINVPFGEHVRMESE